MPDRWQGVGQPAHVAAAYVVDVPPWVALQKILINGASSVLGAGMAHSLASTSRYLSLCARRVDKLDEDAKMCYHCPQDCGRCVGRSPPYADVVRCSANSVMILAGMSRIVVAGQLFVREPGSAPASCRPIKATVDTNLVTSLV